MAGAGRGRVFVPDAHWIDPTSRELSTSPSSVSAVCRCCWPFHSSSSCPGDMGDGVLAYFVYPQAHEDDAERSVRAGLAVVEAVGGLNAPQRVRRRRGNLPERLTAAAAEPCCRLILEPAGRTRRRQWRPALGTKASRHRVFGHAIFQYRSAADAVRDDGAPPPSAVGPLGIQTMGWFEAQNKKG
jgi:hypothetical protein